MTPGLVVAGSLNMDFVLTVDELPAPGETVLGSGFQTNPGGKGANQAYACGRLRAPGMVVRMAGRVGYDVFADALKASLAAAGVDVTFVHATRSDPTGVALIWVDRRGRNSIVVAPGANLRFLPQDVAALRPIFEAAQYALFQLETPLETVEAAAREARRLGCRTILDPAPARPLPRRLLEQVDFLTPNETEACILLGRTPSPVSVSEARPLAEQLRSQAPAATIILKLGEKGCHLFDGEQHLYARGFSVKAEDTTAAGDTFNGALAVALAEGRTAAEALRFANAAAALSVQKKGAQASIPLRAEVKEFLRGLTSSEAAQP